MLRRRRLRSQAAIADFRPALCGYTLLTTNTLVAAGDSFAHDFLGATVGVHLGGVDQRHPEIETKRERRDLARGTRLALAHPPGAHAQRGDRFAISQQNVAHAMALRISRR